MQNPSRTTFRVQNIPKRWNAKHLLGCLHDKYPSLDLHESQISVFPSCCRNRTNTALLHLDSYPQVFKTSGLHQVQGIDGRHIDLEIDSHFYGLTPLDALPEADITAE